MEQPRALSVFILHLKGFAIFRFPDFSLQPPNTDVESLRRISSRLDDYAARFNMLRAQTEVSDLRASDKINVSMNTKTGEAKARVRQELEEFFQNSGDFYAEDMFAVFDVRLKEMWAHNIPRAPHLDFSRRAFPFCTVFQQNVETIVTPLLANMEIEEPVATNLRLQEEDRRTRTSGLGTRS